MTTTTTPTSTASAVRLHEVRRSYPNGAGTIDALAGVSLTLAAGSFTAVMGPSGSGKSTLLNCAAGLDRPTAGQVLIGDADLTALSPDAVTRLRRDRIGFVFQAYNLIGHLTVAENVALPLLLGGREPDPELRAWLMAAVGLVGMEYRLPGELSGGQAQRVAIARALITRPAVVFADEPTGALDSQTGAQVLAVLRDTASALGQTLVLVTHDPQVAAAADRVLFLADGRLAGHLDTPTAAQVTARMIELAR
ncbi:ABC transporter ATP-binding protein [Cellulomonas denverensis]|uniref:ABC transporter ATP-binding protein n=1 Tax=Cellulomonas denverensis TaxID=264297 RepID=A0A7X6KS66_9CELL|nr:ABC transporter ATP-binding protein [Cellulomonas denverensis]NKY21282.1 ABC transporter ATP-binding protein [Cellulomonas denverensis]GIG24575.1 ABC transporter [Cellulomonas denverensis]